MMFWFIFVLGLASFFDTLTVIAYKIPIGRTSNRKNVNYLPGLFNKDGKADCRTDFRTVILQSSQSDKSFETKHEIITSYQSGFHQNTEGNGGNQEGEENEENDESPGNVVKEEVIVKKKKRRVGPVAKRRLRFEEKVAALLRYKELHGDMLVPCKFEVPESEEWPEELWKMRLGTFVTNVRFGRGCKQKESDILRSLGFNFEPQYANRYGFDVVKTAMLKYKELHGDLLIAALFIVPEHPDWPESMWGMKLGFMVNNVRRGSSYADKRAEFLEMGFDYESQHKYGFEIVQQALFTYKKMHGHINVRSRFEVPESDEWAPELWGIKLGTVVHDMRRGTYAERKQDLLDMGFMFSLRKKFDYECVKIAVYKYMELYNGCSKVPAVYNIPLGDLWYPEETWGMCLGSYANRIRRGDIWTDKRGELFSRYR